MRVLRKKERNKVQKNWKAKLSMLMVLCLVLTGSHGLVLSADAQEEQGGSPENKIVVEGNQVNIRLKGEDLRRAAEETLQTEMPYDAMSVQAYSKNTALMDQYRKIFSDDAEIYEIPLEKIETGLESEIFSLDGNVHVFVEKQRRDEQGKEVQKKKKDSLLLFDTESDFRKEFQKLYPELIHFPVKINADEIVNVQDLLESQEEKSSSSDLPKEEYKLTGSELLTFVYENTGEEPLTFQLQVEDNRYPSVTVQDRSKILSSLEKDGEAKFPKKQDATEAPQTDNIDEAVVSEGNTTALPEAGKAQAPAGAEAETENAELSAVSTQSTGSSSIETEVASSEEEVQSDATGVLTSENVVEGETAFTFSGLDLSKVRTAGYVQYSLNELGRQSQFKEIKGFGTVEVFYEKDAFPVPVQMEAKLMARPEEASASELNKLHSKQIERMIEKGIYDDSVFVDIHFREKGGDKQEVEPQKPVGVRISLDNELVPKDVQSEEIAVYHLVEEENDKTSATTSAVKTSREKDEKDFRVEEVLQAGEANHFSGEEFITGEKKEEAGKEIFNQDESRPEKFVKEFQVNSFSVFAINWASNASKNGQIVFIAMDEEGNRIFEYEYRIKDTDSWSVGTKESLLSENVSGLKATDSYLSLSILQRISQNKDSAYKYTKQLRGYGDPVVYEHMKVLGEKVEFLDEVKEFIFNNQGKAEWRRVNDPNPDPKHVPTLGNKGFQTYRAPDVFYVKYPYLSKTGVRIEHVEVDSGAQLKASLPLDGYINSGETLKTHYFTFDDYTYHGLYLNKTETNGLVNYTRKITELRFPNSGANAGKIEYTEEGGSRGVLEDTQKRIYAVYGPLNRSTKQTSWSLPENTVRNDKYIYDRKDGKYDLTLTVEGQNQKQGKKEKVNVLFVYDISKSMNLVLNPIGLTTRRVSAHPPYVDGSLVGLDNPEPIVEEGQEKPWRDPEKRARYEYTTDRITELVKKLDNNTNLDVRYGMVTFSGYPIHRGLEQTKNLYKQEVLKVASIAQDWTENYKDIVEALQVLKPNYKAPEGKYNNTDNKKPEYSGATNYQAGFREAKKLLNNPEANRADAKNIVVLVTDGDPTSWINDRGNTEQDVTRILNRYVIYTNGEISPYTGYFYKGEEVGSGYDYEDQAMEAALKELRSMDKMDAFYAIGVGTFKGYSHLGRLTVPAALPKGTETHKFYTGDSAEALAQAFEELGQYVSTTGISGVSIEDTLSENVDQDPTKVVNVHPEVVRLETVTKMVNGRKVKIPRYSEPITDLAELKKIGLKNGLNSMKASFVPGTLDSSDNTIKGAKLKLEFTDPNYELAPGYRYQIKATVEPSRKAYEKYLDTGYKNTGDKRTDLSDVYEWKPDKYVGKEAELNTSSWKSGWFSNDGAKVYYTPKIPVGSDVPSTRPGRATGEKEKVYQMPVLQVYPGALVLKKRFNGLPNNTQTVQSAAKNISFKIYQEKVINGVASGQQVALGSYRFYTEASRNSASPVLETYAKVQGTGNAMEYSIEIPKLMPGDIYYVEELMDTPDAEYSGNNKNYLFQNWSINSGATEANITVGGKAVKVMKTTMKIGKANGQVQNTEVSLTNNYQEENKQVLKIEKRVSGEMADHSKQFAFRLYLYNKKGTSLNQTEYQRLRDYFFDATTNGKVQFTPAKTGLLGQEDSYLSFTLANGQSLSFVLPENFSYRVGENPDGYMPYIDTTRSTVTPVLRGANNQGFRLTDKAKLAKKPNVGGRAQDEVISFKNEKNPVPPTDVNVTAIPGLILLLGILGSGFVLVQKRRKRTQ